MGRKRREAPKKKSGGVLMGMRGGVQKMAKKVGGADDPNAPAKKLPWYKGKNLVWNIITAVALILAGLFVARRMGWIEF